jgi:hypothetical protein
VSHDDRKSGGSPKRKYLYSEDNNDGHYHHPDKRDTVFATFAAPKSKKEQAYPQIGNRVSREILVFHLVSQFQIGN